MADYRAWYEGVFHELHRHGLWLRGGELNTLPLEEVERRDLRVLFVRLSTYFDSPELRALQKMPQGKTGEKT